jgi:hypothetical protein
MKTSVNKFLCLATIFTVFSLLYVYQQSEVFRLAYTGQKKQLACQNISNKNSLLRYNIDKKTSLVYLGSKISESSEFQMPDSYRYVRVASSARGANVYSEAQEKVSIFGRIFDTRRVAEARTLNP